MSYTEMQTSEIIGYLKCDKDLTEFIENEEKKIDEMMGKLMDKNGEIIDAGTFQVLMGQLQFAQLMRNKLILLSKGITKN
jgi:hypothetical protein